VALQLESDGSRSGSSLSLRNMGAVPPDGRVTTGAAVSGQSPSHRGVHRSISATNSKPSRRASSGGESLRESIASQAAGALFTVLSSIFPFLNLFLHVLFQWPLLLILKVQLIRLSFLN